MSIHASLSFCCILLCHSTVLSSYCNVLRDFWGILGVTKLFKFAWQKKKTTKISCTADAMAWHIIKGPQSTIRLFDRLFMLWKFPLLIIAIWLDESQLWWDFHTWILFHGTQCLSVEGGPYGTNETYVYKYIHEEWHQRLCETPTKEREKSQF